MLTESHVIDGVCTFLRRNGFKISQRLTEKQKGWDIVASTPDGSHKVAIEAKGETSSMAHTSRFGKTFSSNQVFDHVAKAMYCAATYVSQDLMGGIALPKNEAHLKHVRSIMPALATLKIEVFWVLPDRAVEVAGNWAWWANNTIDRTVSQRAAARSSTVGHRGRYAA